MFSCAVIGLEGLFVKVGTDQDLPAIVIVGLLDAAIHESRERIRSAIKNTGQTFVRKRQTINLAPLTVRKGTLACDLPIALGIFPLDKFRPTV